GGAPNPTLVPSGIEYPGNFCLGPYFLAHQVHELPDGVLSELRRYGRQKFLLDHAFDLVHGRECRRERTGSSSLRNVALALAKVSPLGHRPSSCGEASSRHLGAVPTRRRCPDGNDGQIWPRVMTSTGPT